MSFICYICKTGFSKKTSLDRHFSDFRCKSEYLNDLSKLNTICKRLLDFESNIINEDKTYTINKSIKVIEKNEITEKVIEKIENIEKVEKIEQFNIKQVGNNNQFINIKIEINPVTKLQINHLNTEKLKNMIYKYDDMTENTPEKLNLILSEYIKDVICDKNHPENHSVKYTRIRPPTYNCKVEDVDGNTISVIKNLKDACELLTDPILSSLKQKMKEFLKKYQKDDMDDFDYGLYDTAILQLKKEMNNKNVKKALNSVLQNDILNDIEMKFKVSVKNK